MLNDTDIEKTPHLTKEQVSKLSFDEGLAILYHAISTFQRGNLTWEQSMQAAAIIACRELKHCQKELQTMRENTVQMRIVK